MYPHGRGSDLASVMLLYLSTWLTMLRGRGSELVIGW